MVVLAAYTLLIYLLWRIFPEDYYVDWKYAFRPATLALISGKSPYIDTGVYNPPWALIPLIPFAFLPIKLGGILLTISNLVVFAYIVRRLGGNLFVMIAFLLTPQFGLKIILNPNIDFLAALGFLLPSQLGLFFILIKPQIGVAVVLYWLVIAFKKSLREVARVFFPVGLASLLSIAIYGPYFFQAKTNLVDKNLWYEYPLWPYLIPVGLVLLTLAIRHQKIQWAISGSPFLTPYIASYSAVISLLGLVNNIDLFLPAFIGFWISHLLLR